MPDNSIILSAEQQDAYRLDAELKHNAQSVVGGIIEIGRCLKEINDRKLYEHLGYNGLAAYAVASVGLRERAAYNYITAYETYGADGLQKYGQLGITKLVALAQLNEEDRVELLESGEAEELSSRKLNDKIKELKGENDQLRLQFDDITENTKKQDGEIADLKKQLTEAKKASKALSKQDMERLREEIEDEVRDDYKITHERQKELAVKQAVEAEKKKTEKELHKLYEKLAHLEPDNETFQKKIALDAEEIKKLKDENEKLKADAAAPAPAPAPTGNKELLKYHFEALKTAYVGAVEVLERFDANERDKYKTALIKIAGDIKSAVENM